MLAYDATGRRFESAWRKEIFCEKKFNRACTSMIATTLQCNISILHCNYAATRVSECAVWVRVIKGGARSRPAHHLKN